jgi:hypothetical protein
MLDGTTALRTSWQPNLPTISRASFSLYASDVAIGRRKIGLEASEAEIGDPEPARFVHEQIGRLDGRSCSRPRSEEE